MKLDISTCHTVHIFRFFATFDLIDVCIAKSLSLIS